MAKPLVAALAIGAVALLAACGEKQSILDANTNINIAGKVLGSDGNPVPRARVALIKELDIGEVIGGLFVTAASLGIACLTDHPPAICAKNAHFATTDSDGTYVFNVTGSDTQGSRGVAGTMEVMVRGGGRAPELGGPTSFMEFTVQTAVLSLPDLRIWQPTGLSWAADGRITWPVLPGTYGGSPSRLPLYTVEVHDLKGNPWWVAGPVKSGDRTDLRVLEDLNGTLDVVARAKGTASGTTVDYTYVSGALPVKGRAKPPSRGSMCASITSSGVGAYGACPLTSGSAAGGAQSVASATGAIIDLGPDRGVSLLVLRGCGGQCKLELFTDATKWTEAGVVTAAYGTVSIAPGRMAHYVRVTGTGISGLRQVSAW